VDRDDAAHRALNTMGSWLTCTCGARLHRNFFAGTGISVVAGENVLDIDRPGASAQDLVDELVRNCEWLLRCKPCGRIVLLKQGPVDRIRFFTPDA
jgi:hypothetical protein